MDQTCAHYDALILGGGPGGAATAAFLAEAGLRVLIIEKEAHPRFHIGESLLPDSLPILERLGVLERVKEIGVFKPGAEFVSEDGAGQSLLRFDRALLGGPGHAYQVERAKFDQILFNRALELGAQGWENTVATVVSCDEARAVVDARGPDGETRRVRADILVDASGRSTVMANRKQEKDPDPVNDSAAIFGHFRNIPRDPGPDGGNIRIYLIPGGWMWRIPLPEGVTSLGMVAASDRIGARKGTVEAFFREQAGANPAVAALLETAEPIGRMNATGNFSYRARAASDAGHIKVGDAFGFLDPMFSTGVHLALLSAQEAAEAIVAARAAPARRAARFAAYEKRVRRRMDYAAWFIYRIRDDAFRHLLLHPKNYLRIEQAVISLLAGDMEPDWRIRARVALFKLVWRLNKLSGPSTKTTKDQNIAGRSYVAR